MIRWLIASILLLTSAYAQATTLVVPGPAGNFQAGIKFDVTTLANATVTGFSTSVSGLANPGTSRTFQIFTKAGTHVGFNSSAGWTLIGTTTISIPFVETDVFIPVAVSVPVAAGTTQAFYLTISGGFVAYRTQGATGNVQAADGTLQVRIGSGVFSTFGIVVPDRAFVGRVYYYTTPRAIAVISGSPQTATVSTAFTPLGVRATDGGAPVQGELVTFSSPGAGASADLGSPSCITDLAGECTVNATANSMAGAYNVQAAFPGAAAPGSFALTNLALPVPPGLASIPTLSEWAAAVLTLLLASAGVAFTRKVR